jgi:predicted house-cleaning noncanonical NTP pyrophosphatase (MazG superfamily)
MADSPEFVLLNGEDMEDFHDYEDEEHEVGSKLEEYEEEIEEDEDDEIEAPPAVVETVVACTRGFCRSRAVMTRKRRQKP